MSDKLTESILNLTGSLPAPRLNLSRDEKLALIAKVGGPRTTHSIIKAKKDYPASRIPFIFSSLDTQCVVDILANDMTDVLAAMPAKIKS
ncbi:MAG: hypothetical protein WCO71_03850 [Pseudomonadota bacterium]